MLKINLPDEIQITKSLFQQMQWENQGLQLHREGKQIIISGAYVPIEELDFLELKFPVSFPADTFHSFCQGNPNFKKLEFHSNKLQINMAVAGLIGAFSAAILLTIGFWNRKHKLGKIYNDPTGYELSKLGNGNFHKIPDISLVAFQNAVGQLYNENGFIKAQPFLIIEIVSSKYGLQQDLQKMAEHWMANRTQIGLVVDPHREEYHLFEQKQDTYSSFPFSTVFVHEKLTELEIDFGALLKEAMEE